MTMTRRRLRDMEVALSETKRGVLWEYSTSPDGRTQEDARKRGKADRRGKKELTDRWHKQLRTDLVRMGLLRDMTPDAKGRTPHKWKRTLEIIEDETPVTYVPDGPPTQESLRLAKLTLERIESTISSIDEDDSWRKPRRIRTICTNEILPIIQHISDLNGYGLRLTPVHDFFGKENPPYRRWILKSLDLRGPLGIPAPDTEIWTDAAHRSPTQVIRGLEPCQMNEKGVILPVRAASISTIPESRTRRLGEKSVVIGPVRTIAGDKQESGPGMIYPSLPEWHSYLVVVASQIEAVLSRSDDRVSQRSGESAHDQIQ